MIWGKGVDGCCWQLNTFGLYNSSTKTNQSENSSHHRKRIMLCLNERRGRTCLAMQNMCDPEKTRTDIDICPRACIEYTFYIDDIECISTDFTTFPTSIAVKSLQISFTTPFVLYLHIHIYSYTSEHNHNDDLSSCEIFCILSAFLFCAPGFYGRI